ncbi:hypothetical protein TEA_007630 [Camellia sinensis var. sinensis]|uniref:ELMO domain-containing protein n=1 Tax=Camellia sinensis var. sinensis TaxID=542762 RepID=A0A4S4DRL4_CAMSN|nr:hypothetical protein TEA_007630 [Camellia sinensis var. sinensis]
MTSRALRRRLHHGDVDGKRHEHLETSGLDGLDEPLLGNHDYDETCSEGSTLADIWDDERKREHHHWTLLFSQLIAQWAQWLVGSGTLIGRLLPFPSATQNGPTKKLLVPSLSPLQEVRLKSLQQRLQVPFDGSLLEHQDALKQLWRLAYPDRELPSLKSELWKEMGWQGSDPSTDFRGGGYISLENLIYFAKTYPAISFSCHVSLLGAPGVAYYIAPQLCFEYMRFQFQAIQRLFCILLFDHIICDGTVIVFLYLAEIDSLHFSNLCHPVIPFFCTFHLSNIGLEAFQSLLHKRDGRRAEWEYPFAVAGINMSFTLVQMLDIQSGKPTTMAGIRFLDLLIEDEMAFDNLYCIAFQMMDAQWLAMRASYMEFNDVLKSTRTQLERELELEDVSHVKDLPAYNLLKR